MRPLGLLGVLALLACTSAQPDWPAQRDRMVEIQIAARDVSDPRVLEAMRSVPRHHFVPEAEREHAYEDRPISIGSGQTISQPYIVAVMTELLAPEPEDTVLEVGTGSGYQAAVLSLLVDRVYSIEILPELAERSRQTLLALGYDNVTVITGDGYGGVPEHAPFDGILVTAAPEEIPQTLVEQLGVGGRMIVPVGRADQELMLVERWEEGIRIQPVLRVRFVPMVGE